MHQGMTNRHRLSFRNSAFVTNISMFIGLKSKHNSQIPSLKIIFLQDWSRFRLIAPPRKGSCIGAAPPAGLEPATYWLTASRSAN